MSDKVILPENISREISLYMAPGEEVVDALASASGPVGKLGELWMILTDKSVYFHTKEYGREPLVSLIARKDIEVVRYEQHKSGITLNFVQIGFPKNPNQIPFPKSQKQHVNRFCERLAQTVPFELVPPPQKPASKADSEPTSDAPDPGNVAKDSEKPFAPAVAQKTIEKKPLPDVKIVRTPSVTVSPPNPPPAPLRVSSGLQPKPAPKSSPPAVEAVELEVDSLQAPDLQFVLTVTIISSLVGFLWYHLFKSFFNRS